MTTELGAARLAAQIEGALPDAVLEHDERDVWVRPESIEAVARVLKDDPELDFAFLYRLRPSTISSTLRSSTTCCRCGATREPS